MAPLSRFLVLAFSAVLFLQAVIDAQSLVQIQSLLKDSLPIGVSPIRTVQQNVIAGGLINDWVISKPEKDGTVYLRIENSYPYVGYDGEFVIATIDDRENRKWLLGKTETPDVYTIEEASGLSPRKLWTSTSGERGAPVTLQVGDYPQDNQLWRITRQ